MASQKVLNTLRANTRQVLQACITSNEDGICTDNFGNLYMAFTTMQGAVDYFESRKDPIVSYIRECVQITARALRVPESAILAEPYCIANNPKHGVTTDLTKRALDDVFRVVVVTRDERH